MDRKMDPIRLMENQCCNTLLRLSGGDILEQLYLTYYVSQWFSLNCSANWGGGNFQFVKSNSMQLKNLFSRITDIISQSETIALRKLFLHLDVSLVLIIWIK